MTLRPSVNFRPHEAPVSTPLAGNYAFTVIEDTFEIAAQKNIPALRLMLHGKEKSLTMDRTRFQEIVYRIEESRGYAAHGDLWSPGYFSVVLTPQDACHAGCVGGIVGRDSRGKPEVCGERRIFAA